MRIRTCRRLILLLCACIGVATIVIILIQTSHDDWPKEHLDLSYIIHVGNQSQSDQLQLLPATLAKLVSFKRHAKIHSIYATLNRTQILAKLENIRTPRFKKEKCLTEFGFNTCISEALPLQRRLHVERTSGCSKKKYPKHLLPLVSIILPLVNEHWQTTIRMLYSLAQMTRRELLQEIILVHGEQSADFSSGIQNYCQKQLKHLPIKVVSCAEGDSGMYKLEGALKAVGEVLVFLSPRMEFIYNWLPPLLEPLVLDHRKVTTPHVDIIEPVTFEHTPVLVHRRTVFDWKLRIKHFDIFPETENLHNAFETPLLSSELFAIRNSFYWELGGHDGTLSEIHAEILDLSFKIWLCGGSISAVPCSHCAYIDPTAHKRKRNTHQLLDYRHVSARWMDEYQNLVYSKKSTFHELSPGNITGHQDQKDEMACRPFRWYLEKVAYEVLKEFPIKRKPLASGLLRNHHCDRCLMAGSIDKGVSVRECKITDDYTSPTLERNGDLTAKLEGRSRICLAINRPERAVDIDYADSIVTTSAETKTDYFAYEWRYNLETEQLTIYPYKFCIHIQDDCKEVMLRACDGQSIHQKWQFSKIDKEAVLRHYEYGDDGGSISAMDISFGSQ